MSPIMPGPADDTLAGGGQVTDAAGQYAAETSVPPLRVVHGDEPVVIGVVAVELVCRHY
jgi:hypothetical protein